MAFTSKELRDYRNNKRIGKIAQTILYSVGVVGFLAVAVMAPNALQILGIDESKRKEWYMHRVAQDLVDRGLLKKVKKGNRTGYELTDKGEKLATGYQLKTLSIKKPWNWDGNWRVVMFDIPEFKKSTREELRSTLIALGFVSLQKSAWVHPYPCADVITLIKRKYELGREVLYLEVDKLENDHWLREEFDLK
ncbi:MAG TPA: hypothetical protein VJB98_01570 [Candidatus Paceibacterota bacterium]